MIAIFFLLHRLKKLTGLDLEALLVEQGSEEPKN
jgi:hypothetical protein